MITRKTFLILVLLSVLFIGSPFNAQLALARFGGAGVGRGNFGRGDFDRGDYSHADGWGDRAGDPFGNIDRSYYSDAAQRPLATDGGMGKFMDSHLAAPVHGAGYGAYGHADWAAHGDAVRHCYDRRCFDRDWWAAHHYYGYYYPWMGGAYCWGYTSWPMMAGFMGLAAASYPAAYDYGNNITYQDNNVYYGTEPVATAAEYNNQANTLATRAPDVSPTTTDNNVTTSESSLALESKQASELPKLKPENEKDWKPLGVFSLVQGGQTDSSKLFQLMVNKDGYIRGNFYDVLTDEVKPVNGAIDKKSMRAAWKVSGVKDVVYDTGLSNLLKPQSPILIHMGKEQTQQWELVRLEQPGKSSATDKNTANGANNSTEKTSNPADKATKSQDNTI